MSRYVSRHSRSHNSAPRSPGLFGVSPQAWRKIGIGAYLAAALGGTMGPWVGSDATAGQDPAADKNHTKLTKIPELPFGGLVTTEDAAGGMTTMFAQQAEGKTDIKPTSLYVVRGTFTFWDNQANAGEGGYYEVNNAAILAPPAEGADMTATKIIVQGQSTTGDGSVNFRVLDLSDSATYENVTFTPYSQDGGPTVELTYGVYGSDLAHGRGPAVYECDRDGLNPTAPEWFEIGDIQLILGA